MKQIFLNLVHLLSFAIQFISTPLKPDLTIWLIKNLLKSKKADDNFYKLNPVCISIFLRHRMGYNPLSFDAFCSLIRVSF